MYCAGDYKNMNINEKIDFIHNVYTEKISLWDEEGYDNDIYDDYFAVEEDLESHPENLTLNDMLSLMKIFDDKCFELSMQHKLADIVLGVALYYKKQGVEFFLQNLNKVPPAGRFHGWNVTIQMLMSGKDTYPLLKEVLGEQDLDVKNIVLSIVNDIDAEYLAEEKNELAKMLGINMVELTNLNNDDANFILANWTGENALPGYFFPNSRDEILKYINEWNKKSYEGKYFEMFFIKADNKNVGLLSLYEHNIDTVSIGISIQSTFQNQGIGTTALKMAVKKVKKDGYRNITSQCKVDNYASVSLHKKCGFVITDRCLNKRGHEVFMWKMRD